MTKYLYKLYTGNIWQVKLANLVNCELFIKFFFANIHSYTKKLMYLVYALTVAYSPNFSLPIALVHQNFPPPNISHVQYKIQLLK